MSAKPLISSFKSFCHKKFDFRKIAEAWYKGRDRVQATLAVCPDPIAKRIWTEAIKDLLLIKCSFIIKTLVELVERL